MSLAERSAVGWGNVGSNQGAREPEQVTSIDVDLLDHLRPLAGGEGDPRVSGHRVRAVPSAGMAGSSVATAQTGS